MSLPESEKNALKKSVREAAQWFSLLNSGSVSQEQLSQWKLWMEASELNQKAWTQLESIQAKFGALPKKSASVALLKTDISRRHFMKTIGALSVVLPVAGLTYALMPCGRFEGECSAVGERRVVALPDGSELVLNTDTQLKIHFTQQERLIELLQGEVYLSSAKDTLKRDLVIETPQGRITALGTKFTVRTLSNETRVHVLQDRVLITPSSLASSELILSSAQMASFSKESVGLVEQVPRHAVSWLEGSLIVVDMPMTQLVEELSRYKQGYLLCDEALANIYVSGAFPLDDIDLSLNTLAQSFPVKMQQLTPYWIRFTPL